MQRLIAVLALLGTFWTTSTGAQEKFPYVGYIQGDNASARGGPGSEYYTTDKLEDGTKVEVYRHVEGGWCAIRPPLTSFNWIPASSLKMTDEQGVAEITGENVVALVGTNTQQPQQYRWQIRLDRGELVEVLGVKQNLALDGGAPQSWCKISPPAGEFRWIEIRHITRKALLGATSPPFAQAPVSQAPITPVPAAASKPEPTVVRPAPGFRDITAEVKAAANDNTFSANATPAAGNFSTKLQQIDLELSAVLAGNPSSQQFADLLAQTEQLLESGKTPLDRGRARLLLTKIGQFERFEQRRRQRGDTINGDAVQFDNSLFAKGNDPPVNLDATATLPRADQRFDGSGRLVPLRGRRRTAPPYALVSKDNRVIQYVTPAPGINLHRYLGRQVGIHGQTNNTNSKLQRPHLTAQNIKVLDRNLR